MATVTTKKLGSLGLNMMEYLPTNYDKTKAYTCLIYSVGAGEIGTNASLLTVHGPFLYLKSGVDLGIDLIVLAVQNTTQNPRPAEVQMWIDAIKSAYNVSAIIATGISRGGENWSWYANNAESQLKQLTALALFSSQGTVSDMAGIPGTYNPQLYANDGIYLWQGCGTMDSFYDARKAENAALTKIAPNLSIWTDWMGAGHGDPVWSDAYNPTWTKNALGKSLYQWSASFGASAVVTPPITVPPPPVIPSKTIKSITIAYSDGTSETRP